MPYSPQLSIITAAFEVGAALWILRRGGRNRHLAASLLLLLAGYQGLEWLACATPSRLWLARLAFADVAWLPPVGILLVVRLVDSKRRWPHYLARAFMGAAGVASVAALLLPGFISGTICQAVFATYRTHAAFAYTAYGVFYDLGLLTMIFGGLWGMVRVEDPTRRAMLADFVGGSLAFVLAALMTLVAVPEARGASPSILCHYALLLAVAILHMAHREPAGIRAQPTSGDGLKLSNYQGQT